MRFLGILAVLLLFAGCISNVQESKGNKIVKIVGEKIYNESEEGGEGAGENATLNETEGNATDLNITNETFETQNYSENEAEQISGTYFGNNKYVLVLSDISMQRNERGYCALFEIVEAKNGSTLQKMQICPGDDATWISPEGHAYRIKVFDTAAGYTGAARWAKVAVYG